MPRLSVEIALTYVPTNERETALREIRGGLTTISQNIISNIPDTKVNFQKEQWSKSIPAKHKVIIENLRQKLQILILEDLRNRNYPEVYVI